MISVETFLKKLKELRESLPRIFSTSRENENALYAEAIAYSKNCYYLFLGGWLEDCYYGELLVKCQDCVDCTKIEQSSMCYECVECISCYNSNYLFKCTAVQDSEYCLGIRNSSHCFLTANRDHVSYVFKNEQYTKEAYESLVRAYKKEKTARKLKDEWQELCDKTPRINLAMTQCENCLGSDLSFSKNVYTGFDLVNAEDFMYSEEGGYGKDCCDTFLATRGELHYECYSVAKNSYNCNFCVELVTCSNCEFCSRCYDCADCFGCCYLKGKRSHILNTPYTPEAYKKELEHLKKALLNAGKYNFSLMV